ncbi:WD repeat-containing protein 53 [Apophysomyces sp. BC1021]|nr:WD repeat-containing protein 53 [Apophysomyces sp. BC1021]
MSVDLETHKIHKQIAKKHKSICMAVRFRSKKPWEVWSGGLDSRLFQWDFSRGMPSDVFDMNERDPSPTQMFNPPFVYALEISADGKWIAAGLGDSTIQVLSQESSKKRSKKDEPINLRLENGHNAMVNCLSFLPSTEGYPLRLLSGSANGSVALWNLSTEGNCELAQTYKLDASVGRLNWLKTFALDESNIHVAAAGVGSTADKGALNIYTLSNK